MWLDILIFVVVIIATIYGLIKGLVRGVLGIVGLILGIWIASRYYSALAIRFPFNPTVSNILAFIIIFLAVLAGVSIIGFIVRKIVHFASLGWIDRILGLVLGFFIGVCINWVICMLILSFAPSGKDVIAQSRFAPRILSFGEAFKRYFPTQKEDCRDKFFFS